MNYRDSWEAFEELAKKWPDLLLKRTTITVFDCGDGWMEILDTLFEVLSARVTRIQHEILLQGEGDDSSETKQYLNERLEEEINKLPSILQVKEKYGSLRIYLDKPTEESKYYIRFAEAMSRRTCETCGNRGELRALFWPRTLCDIHYAEQM